MHALHDDGRDHLGLGIVPVEVETPEDRGEHLSKELAMALVSESNLFKEGRTDFEGGLLLPNLNRE